MILGIDLSHHQGAPDLAAVRRSGRRFVVLKATEGTGWTDPELGASRSRAHAAVLIVGLYHYAGAGAPPPRPRTTAAPTRSRPGAGRRWR